MIDYEAEADHAIAWLNRHAADFEPRPAGVPVAQVLGDTMTCDVRTNYGGAGYMMQLERRDGNGYGRIIVMSDETLQVLRKRGRLRLPVLA